MCWVGFLGRGMSNLWSEEAAPLEGGLAQKEPGWRVGRGCSPLSGGFLQPWGLQHVARAAGRAWKASWARASGLVPRVSSRREGSGRGAC